MRAFLSPDEKKYLRVISNYLNSLGMTSGVVDFDVDSGTEFDPSDINWKFITHFSNNYRAEIPENLILIFRKIFQIVSSRFDLPTAEDINWENVSIEIDTDEKVLRITHNWSFTKEGNTNVTEWDYTEDEEVGKLFETLESEVPNADKYLGKYLNLKYDGGGDSGYIDDSFDEGDTVPTSVSDWCYDKLESSHGGWENNEGGRGTFEFDFDNKKITLYHTENYNEDESNTIYEESFAK